ncbi:MAG: DegV family protein, partial [Anaerolineae bacterium]|nr:DegV family protein [Anaerolineae bacterium]
MDRIAIVTDSASNLPPEVAAQYSITVMPIYLHWDGRTYRDGVDITPDEVYRRLRENKHMPHTAAPSAGDFLQTYLRLGHEAKGIVSVHLPTELSSTIASAQLAANLAAAEVPVRVVDAGTAAMGAGFVALAAARAAARGADLETVVQTACAISPKVMVYVVFDTLKYLQRSGRIGRAASLMGAALQIKPIIYLNGNVVDVLAEPRTRTRALRMMLDKMAERVDGRPMHVAIMHADAAEDANRLRERVEARFHCI